MRSQSLTRSFAALALVSMFLLSAFARPALAQTPDKHKVKPPNVSFSNKKFNFGQIFVGDISSPQTETITNDSSTTAVTISDITAAAPFHISSDNCTTSLAAGASCEVGVDFQPTKKGKVKAKKGLNFTDSAQKSPQHIELQGDGVIQTQPTATATATATATQTATATATTDINGDRDRNCNADRNEYCDNDGDLNRRDRDGYTDRHLDRRHGDGDIDRDGHSDGVRNFNRRDADGHSEPWTAGG